MNKPREYGVTRQKKEEEGSQEIGEKRKI